MERDLHRRSVSQHCTPQPETCVHQCGRGLGAEAWASEVRPGEKTGVGCAETALRGWILVWLKPRVYAEEAQAHHRGKVPLLRARKGRGGTWHSSLLPCTCTLRRQDTACTGSRSRHQPLLWAQGWAWATDAIAGSRGTSEPPPYRELWERVPAATFAGSGRERQPLLLHTPYQWDNSQHTLRKETAGIHTKTTLTPKILKPHKLHRAAPTYKQPSKTTVDKCFS